MVFGPLRNSLMRGSAILSQMGWLSGGTPCGLEPFSSTSFKALLLEVLVVLIRKTFTYKSNGPIHPWVEVEHGAPPGLGELLLSLTYAALLSHAFFSQALTLALSSGALSVDAHALNLASSSCSFWI